MRLAPALLALALPAAPGACSKPAPAPAPPAPATVAAPAPAPTAPTPPPAPADPADAAAPADPADATAPPAPAAPPTTFTPTDSPPLADIPAAPLRARVLGRDYEAPTVTVKYAFSDWSLEVRFSETEHFTLPLSDKPEAPAAGYSTVTPKQCCPGYLHRSEGGARPVSLNAPNGLAIEITAWDVAPWKDDGGMEQPGGTVKGRLAVVYDADNWAAGQFETTLTYFGEPPVVRQAREARERVAAQEAVAAWKELPAPSDLVLAPGAKVWAASVGRGRWEFGEVEVQAVDGALVTLADERFTAPGLVRPMAPLAEPKAGAFVAAVDHLGPQFARVVTPGDPAEVAYLNPASQPRTNSLPAARLFPFATEAAGAGMPPLVFFEHEGHRTAGLAVAAVGDDLLVIRDGGDALLRIPRQGAAVAGAFKALKKGAKVEAVLGCGMNSWSPREGKVLAVLEGGLGYEVEAEPCKGTVGPARLRAR